LSPSDQIQKKIASLQQAIQTVEKWRGKKESIAFTNGVFDILHQGHIFSLSQAANEADHLIVGLNSDRSVKKLKGDSRPVNNQDSRAIVVASLLMVDLVIIFDDDTPLELIKSILPDVLVKGGDYKVEEIAGAKEIIGNGGRVVINPILPGYSTTGIIQSMKNK
jgi:D-beta-D-heptose 7-phosphate kinase/D-beta-D-heptose 1-phosphate adenosyltransferase